MTYYYCIIKSHSEYPDFECEGEAPNKKKFAENIVKKYDWDEQLVIDNTISEEELYKYR